MAEASRVISCTNRGTGTYDWAVVEAEEFAGCDAADESSHGIMLPVNLSPTYTNMSNSRSSDST